MGVILGMVNSCCLQPTGQPGGTPGQDAGQESDAGLVDAGADGGPLDAGPICNDGGLFIPGSDGGFVRLPSATINIPVEYQLVAQGGCPPYDWSSISGAGVLPPGFSLEGSGKLSGVPNQSGQFSFQGAATDLLENVASARYTLEVDP
jgi:Putative Ig domain